MKIFSKTKKPKELEDDTNNEIVQSLLKEVELGRCDAVIKLILFSTLTCVRFRSFFKRITIVGYQSIVVIQMERHLYILEQCMVILPSLNC
jgi:hypothetical protein